MVGYFGLAHQYFLLNFGGRGKTYFALFLFLAWVLPLVAGTILAMSSQSNDGGPMGQFVFSLSPVPAIAMVAAPSGTGRTPMAVQGPAITIPLLFLFVFNSLLISARRRAYKAFLAQAGTVGNDQPAAAVIHGGAARIDTGTVVAKAELSP